MADEPRAKKPPTAGYSGTPLPKKLGIKPATSVLALAAPADFLEVLGELPDGVQVSARGRGPFHVALAFATRRTELRKRFDAAASALGDAGRLWVAWPKKASGMASELTEDTVRAHGLAKGWVDYKVCAIDATWSGLCFARRKA